MYRHCEVPPQANSVHIWGSTIIIITVQPFISRHPSDWPEKGSTWERYLLIGGINLWEVSLNKQRLNCTQLLRKLSIY